MYDKEFKEKVCKEYIESDITRKEICEKYNIKFETFKDWLRRERLHKVSHNKDFIPSGKVLTKKSYLKDMSREELQREIIKRDFEIARLKKSIHG